MKIIRPNLRRNQDTVVPIIVIQKYFFTNHMQKWRKAKTNEKAILKKRGMKWFQYLLSRQKCFWKHTKKNLVYFFPHVP